MYNDVLIYNKEIDSFTDVKSNEVLNNRIYTNTASDNSVNFNSSLADAFNKLDFNTRIWASTLTSDDLSHILQSVYKIPQLVQSLKNSKPQYAADIGKQGEQDFIKMCKTLPENYSIVNTAKQGKQGDFIIVYRHNNQMKKCLVDVKKYTTSVPKKEIDKFHEDLTYGSYDAGLIISYSSKFTGISDNIFLEDKQLMNGVIPVMYLANIDTELILQCIKVLMLKTLVTESCDIKLTRIEYFINTINNTLSQSASTRRLLSEMQQEISKSIQRCQENLISLEVQTKKCIKEINNVIEEEKIAILKKNAPKLTERDDNIEDTKLQPDKDLNISRSNEVNVKELNIESNTNNEISNDEESDEVEFDEAMIKVIEMFRKKDQNLVVTLLEYGMDCDYQKDYILFTYQIVKSRGGPSSKTVNLILKPLKTRTNVILCIPRSLIKHVPEDLIERGSFDTEDNIFRNIELRYVDNTYVVYTGALTADILSFVESTLPLDS